MSFDLASTSSSGQQRAWSNELYFDPESDQPDGITYLIPNSELPTKMKSLVNLEEKIIEVILCKVPLKESQWTLGVLNHHFIIFRTEMYWWSIEKNDEGLTLQRSKKRDAVLKRYRKTPRISGSYWEVTEAGEARGEGTLGNLIRWLCKENYLNQGYSWVGNNCKGFVRAVFKNIAKNAVVILGIVFK